MAEIEQMEWGDSLVPPRKDAELKREFKRNYGIVTPAFPYFAHSPWLVRAQSHGNYRAGQLAYIALDLADLIFLAVSQDNSCRFCYVAQRSVLRILGFDDERIRRTEEAASSAEMDPSEKCALDFARRFSRANPAPGLEDWERLGSY